MLNMRPFLKPNTTLLNVLFIVPINKISGFSPRINRHPARQQTPAFKPGLLICACVAVVVFRQKANYRVSGENIEVLSGFRSEEGLITTYPYEKDSAQIIKIKDLYIKAQLYPQFKLGDYIRISSKSDSNFIHPARQQTPAFRPGLLINYPQIIVDRTKSIPWLIKINQFREKIVERVRANMPEPYAGLILGMTIGYKEPFTPDFSHQLIAAGVMHVVVVSGYNVALLQNFIGYFLSRFGRAVFLLGSFVFLLCYLAIVGLEPPIIRASITGCINTIALFLGREKDTLYGLVLAGVFMLIANPAYLNNISFQFSFASAFFIVLSTKLARNLGLKFYVAELAAICVTGVMMYPISAYYFGKIYPLGVFSNVFISGLIPLITIAGFIYILFPIIIFKYLLIIIINPFVAVIKVAENLAGEGYSVDLSTFALISVYGLAIVLIMLLKFILRLKRREVDENEV